MSRIANFFKKMYIYIILAFVYIPLLAGTVFSFNQTSKKGTFTTTFNRPTWNNWLHLFDSERDVALVNSIIIAIVTSIIVIAISLITVWSIYHQRQKIIKGTVTATSNIPLINPDNITAIGLVLVFAIFFGIISSDSEGLWRVIVAHTVMTLPYGISLMLPRSEKFNNNLLEASQDLGYSVVRSWFKTYFIYMLPSIIMTFVVSTVLSFDDFIITRTVSNTSTIGLKLYEGAFESWALVLGTILLFISLLGNIIYVFSKRKNLVESDKNKKQSIFKKLFKKVKIGKDS